MDIVGKYSSTLHLAYTQTFVDVGFSWNLALLLPMANYVVYD